MGTATDELKIAIASGFSKKIEKQLEKLDELENQAQLYRRILDSMAEGWWSWNVQTNETYQNPRWFQMLGYDPNASTPSLDTWLSLLHPDDKDYALQEQTSLSKQQESWQMIFRMKAKDDCYHWILSTGTVTKRAEDGSPLELAGTHRDLTYEQKNRVLFSPKNLKAPLFQMILSVNPGAIKIYDYLRKKIVYSARLNEMIFGETEPNRIGLRHHQIIETLHPEDRPILLTHEQNMRTALDGEVLECYFRVKNAEGDYIWLWLRDTVYQRNEAGEPTQLLGTLTDITQFHGLEGKLKKALNTLDDLAKANSHELRAPLANLLGLVDLMEEQIPLSKPASTLLNYMKQTIQKLDQVIHYTVERLEEDLEDL